MSHKKAEPTRWFWIMTIKRMFYDQSGEMCTGSGRIFAHPGQTRQELFDLLYQRMVKDAEVEEAFVVFFSLERDDLSPDEGQASTALKGQHSVRRPSELEIKIRGRRVERSVAP
ncbi:hypothetical protein ACH4SP_37070 [Streptomyces sp. NPDC021093]|uniref:hypothetical protein n=1 Tax=Streptomyces sp. NPDC021093 TaxID=3365112 RepID=UPI0037AC35DD